MRPLILSLETATMAGSLCIARGREILTTSVGEPNVSHSNTLLKEIDDLLKSAGVSLKQIDLFSVAVGPGSFTGLRIGIATAKALAETLNRPCVGVPTLAAIAHSAGPSSAMVAMLPAGRGELFVQLFSVSDAGEVTELDDAAHLKPVTAFDRYRSRSPLCFAGDGANQQKELIEARGWSIAQQSSNLAQDVALLSISKFELGEVETATSLRAIYVRPSDAELKV
jgi:tRNA threonylcarbamoyladenosine biosynthesis protein TsaB